MLPVENKEVSFENILYMSSDLSPKVERMYNCSVVIVYKQSQEISLISSS